MYRLTSILSVFLFILLSACSSGTKKGEGKTGEAVKTKKFEMVDVPIMYTTPEARAEYVAAHYWDNFDFKDTAYVDLPEVTEQAWVDYLNILSMVPHEMSIPSLQSTIKQTEVDPAMFSYFKKLADKYLYDPNSPMRNEELYISVLETLLGSSLNTEAEKSTLDYRLNLAKKNRVGEKATDFNYTLASGARSNLYGIQADYILLFINNPGCTACTEVVDALKSSRLLSHLLLSKKLKVLTLYPDEDLEEWKRHLADMSLDWINAYDKELAIKDKELYDLKAIPTLYLLDKNKTVLLKDAPFGMIEQYLSNSFY